MLLILQGAETNSTRTDFHKISSLHWGQGQFQPSEFPYLTQDIRCHADWKESINGGQGLHWPVMPSKKKKKCWNWSLHCWHYTSSNSLEEKSRHSSVMSWATARNKFFFWRLFSNLVSTTVEGSVKTLSYRPLQILVLTKGQNYGMSIRNMGEWWGKIAASLLTWAYCSKSNASWPEQTEHKYNKWQVTQLRVQDRNCDWQLCMKYKKCHNSHKTVWVEEP
jgi:hypothetical protein